MNNFFDVLKRREKNCYDFLMMKSKLHFDCHFIQTNKCFLKETLSI